MEAVKKYIDSQRHNFDKGFDWRLMSISNETANQLLNGKFKTFQELRDFDVENRSRNTKIEILYKEQKNENKESIDYLIETIFIDE